MLQLMSNSCQNIDTFNQNKTKKVKLTSSQWEIQGRLWGHRQRFQVIGYQYPTRSSTDVHTIDHIDKFKQSFELQQIKTFQLFNKVVISAPGPIR